MISDRAGTLPPDRMERGTMTDYEIGWEIARRGWLLNPQAEAEVRRGFDDFQTHEQIVWSSNHARIESVRCAGCESGMTVCVICARSFI